MRVETIHGLSSSSEMKVCEVIRNRRYETPTSYVFVYLVVRSCANELGTQTAIDSEHWYSPIPRKQIPETRYSTAN